MVLEYSSIGKKLLMVDELPNGVNLKSDMIYVDYQDRWLPKTTYIQMTPELIRTYIDILFEDMV